MLLTKAEPGNFCEKDKDRPVYILGTAPDLLELPLTFWQEYDIIGLNHSFQAPYARDNLDHWICCDAVMPFVDWIKNDRKVNKWVYKVYRCDPRLGPRIYNSVLYGVVDFPPLQRDYRNGLYAQSFTLTAALSLAYALGYKDVRMRGIRFGAGGENKVHFNDNREWFGSEVHRNAMESLYGHQRKIIREVIVPEYKRLGLTLVNETPGAVPLEQGE
jgi:hypothetical protein